MGRKRRSRFSVLCPDCGHDTEVVCTDRSGRVSVSRRRKCPNCRTSFRTVEKVVPASIRKLRDAIYPLGDQLDEPFGITGSTLTVPPAGRGTKWLNSGGFRDLE